MRSESVQKVSAYLPRDFLCKLPLQDSRRSCNPSKLLSIMYKLLPTISLLLATAAAWGPSQLPQCSPRVISLATGIFINIGGQHCTPNLPLPS